jgi:hypothetical protein
MSLFSLVLLALVSFLCGWSAGRMFDNRPGRFDPHP